MTYSSASDVAAYCPEMMDGGTNFSATTKPTVTQINAFITVANAKVDSSLAAAGYEVPAGAGATVYPVLRDLEALYVAARAHAAVLSARLGPDDRPKAFVFKKMFEDGMRELLSSDLTMAGLTRASTGTLYAGGISKDDKETYEDDTDRVEPRFKRDQFRTTGTLRPASAPDSDDESE